MGERSKDFPTLRLFTRVARLGSFSAAARDCGMSQSQASRMIAELESELGARLLLRTTRAVVPTDTGAAFLASIEPILLALDEAELAIRDGGELRGVLRVSAPTSVAVREIIPRLAPFFARHPLLQVNMTLDDRRQDLVRDAVDVAIRFGRLADSGATARQIATVPRVVVAAPAYLASAGIPHDPQALTGHRIVAGPASNVPTGWVFEKDGETVHPQVDAMFSTNENEGVIAATLAGMGICSTVLWACSRELDEGRLVRLFPEWKTTPAAVHAYFPSGRATRSAARAMVDHLVADLSGTGEETARSDDPAV
ncbi:DNA-binding transcriptional regulator, LysR family [Luteibacter sp. UNCMF331Sha3.1]|uniref:LysR family transcriptional regulator n=1 Tax=Luteibacter sp. UNCMF331Sha3.1 TaxID=1502760 RepID=UPI0008CF5C28|nr:LysR family transcriptional regulator [Luteibacter sp. UNCMF331Sha3.1]SEN10510.1 DNA-binding transcriptional regulator, LysR family [Luteibacter sp. UNCMF331Sha3.1]